MWPLETLSGKELHIAFEQVLIDEETGARLSGEGDWAGLRAGAKYRCEREWQLRAGQSRILARFDSEEAATAALKHIAMRLDEGMSMIYIWGAV